MRPLLALLALALFASPLHGQRDLDAFYDEVVRTVEAGDAAGLLATYHPDGVLVSRARAIPIGEAVEGWKPGLEATREGRNRVELEFRFTERVIGEDVVHDTGIFRHATLTPGQEPAIGLVHFRALLVRRDGEWKMVMEHQVAPATPEEWEAAGG